MITTLINLDPTVIVITRHTKVPHFGGFQWDDDDLDPITVRLYLFATHSMREVNIEEGEIKTVTVGLLAQPDADIVVGHDSYDTFPHDGRTYRIVGVRTYDSLDLGVMACKQADCVVV